MLYAANGDRVVSCSGLCCQCIFSRRAKEHAAAQDVFCPAGGCADSSGAGRRHGLYGASSGNRTAVFERCCSQAVPGQHGAGDLSVLSVYRHSGGGRDRQAPAAGLACQNFSGSFGAGQFPAAHLLHRDPQGKLFLRTIYAGALLGRRLLSAAVRRSSGCKLGADRSQKETCHRFGADH